MLRKYQLLAANMCKEIIKDPVKTLVDNPKQVCMSYGEHCRFSLTLAGLHLYGCAASTINAFFPCWYTQTTSELNARIQKMINDSGSKTE